MQYFDNSVQLLYEHSILLDTNYKHIFAITIAGILASLLAGFILI